MLKSSQTLIDNDWAFAEALDDALSKDRQGKPVLVYPLSSFQLSDSGDTTPEHWISTKRIIKDLLAADVVVVTCARKNARTQSSAFMEYPTIWASEELPLIIEGEAHPIFWAKNAFIFPDQDTMHAFIHRFGAKSFELIRTPGVEQTVNAMWINVNGGRDLGYWFTDVGTAQFPQTLYLHGWETKFEEHNCKRERWVPDLSDPSEVKLRKFMP